MNVLNLDRTMPFPTLGDEPWQRDVVNRAIDIFGEKRTPSQLFAAVRSEARVIEYFEQAPVLAVIALDQSGLRAMAGGERPKRIINSAGGANILRRFRGRALNLDQGALMRRLATINPSVLAQAIPDDFQRQRHFLSNAQSLFKAGQSEAINEWFLGRIAPLYPREAASAIDYMTRSGRAVDLRWTAAEAHQAAQRWHRDLAKQTQEKSFFRYNGVEFDALINYGKFPEKGDCDGFDFVALRSGAALFEDGATMHHCVGSYSRDVIKGTSRIYSVRKAGKNIATTEFKKFSGRGGWTVAQTCGPCNQRVEPEVTAACGTFLADALRRERKAAA